MPEAGGGIRARKPLEAASRTASWRGWRMPSSLDPEGAPSKFVAASWYRSLAMPCSRRTGVSRASRTPGSAQGLRRVRRTCSRRRKRRSPTAFAMSMLGSQGQRPLMSRRCVSWCACASRTSTSTQRARGDTGDLPARLGMLADVSRAQRSTKCCAADRDLHTSGSGLVSDRDHCSDWPYGSASCN